MLINADTFEEAGIEIPTEWTYDEFREIAKKLTHGEGQGEGLWHVLEYSAGYQWNVRLSGSTDSWAGIPCISVSTRSTPLH